MNEKVIKFKNAIINIFKSVTKQKVIFIMSVIAAVFGIVSIYIGGHKTTVDVEKYISELFYCFLFGTLCSIPSSYLTEKLVPLKKYFIQAVTAVLTAGGCFLLVHFVKEESYRDMYYLGIAFAVICFTVFILVPKQKKDAYYANIFKNFLFCGVIALLGFAGCSLLVAAFSYLLVEIEDMGELIESLFIVSYVVFFVNLYVFYLFEKREEASGKAFKIVFMYVGLPVYGLLLLVLYSYLIKMLVTWSVPKGQINWFVSFATVFYLVLYFILQEYRENKVMKLFYKYGAIVMIPLVLVQYWAYFVRLNAYGFTGWRYTSLLYNLFVTAFLIFTFIKQGRFVKYAIPVLGAIIILSSITPLNLINVAYDSQFKRMTGIMEKYSLWQNGQPELKNNAELEHVITAEDRDELREAFNYLAYTSEHKKPEWMLLDDAYNFEALFNIRPTDLGNNLVEVKSRYDLFETPVDIQGFSSMIEYDQALYGETWDDRKNYSPAILKYNNFDATEYLLNYKNRDKPLIIQMDNGDEILFKNIYYRYDTEKQAFLNFNLKYIVLYKNKNESK